MKKFLLLMLFVLKGVLISSPIIGILVLTCILNSMVSSWFTFLLILEIPAVALSIFLAFILDPIDTLDDAFDL